MAIFKPCKLQLCNLDERVWERKGLEQGKRREKPSSSLSLWLSKHLWEVPPRVPSVLHPGAGPEAVAEG